METDQFLRAASSGDLHEVRGLFSKITDIDVRDENGQTALILAAAQGHLGMAKLLLEKGADINAAESTCR